MQIRLAAAARIGRAQNVPPTAGVGATSSKERTTIARTLKFHNVMALRLLIFPFCYTSDAGTYLSYRVLLILV